MKYRYWLLLAFIFGIFMNSCVEAAKNSLNRPQMVIDENGKCVSASGPKGPIDCKGIAKKDYGRFDISTAYRNIEIKS